MRAEQATASASGGSGKRLFRHAEPVRSLHECAVALGPRRQRLAGTRRSEDVDQGVRVRPHRPVASAGADAERRVEGVGNQGFELDALPLAAFLRYRVGDVGAQHMIVHAAKAHQRQPCGIDRCSVSPPPSVATPLRPTRAACHTLSCVITRVVFGIAGAHTSVRQDDLRTAEGGIAVAEVGCSREAADLCARTPEHRVADVERRVAKRTLDRIGQRVRIRNGVAGEQPVFVVHLAGDQPAAAGKSFDEHAFSRIDAAERLTGPGAAVVGQPRHEEILVERQRRAAKVFLMTAKAVPSARADLDLDRRDARPPSRHAGDSRRRRDARWRANPRRVSRSRRV